MVGGGTGTLPPDLQRLLKEKVEARGLDVAVAHKILSAIITENPSDQKARIREILEEAAHENSA